MRTQPTNGARVARAVMRAVAEHGAPNRFSPGELDQYGCRLTPLAIGLCAWDAVLRLQDAGYVARYGSRHFIVDAEPERVACTCCNMVTVCDCAPDCACGGKGLPPAGVV